MVADFCKQCSIENFGEDFGDLARLKGDETLKEGFGWCALCEGCGPTLVNNEGECVSPTCLKGHGKISTKND